MATQGGVEAAGDQINIKRGRVANNMVNPFIPSSGNREESEWDTPGDFKRTVDWEWGGNFCLIA